jgi:hypothetical protein
MNTRILSPTTPAMMLPIIFGFEEVYHPLLIKVEVIDEVFVVIKGARQVVPVHVYL